MVLDASGAIEFLLNTARSRKAPSSRRTAGLRCSCQRAAGCYLGASPTRGAPTTIRSGGDDVEPPEAHSSLT